MNLLNLGIAAELNNKTESDNNDMKKSTCNTIIDFSRRKGDRVNVINNDNEATIWGFNWFATTCAYDCVLTTLWIAYFTDVFYSPVALRGTDERQNTESWLG